MPEKKTTSKRSSNKRLQNRRKKERYWTRQINAYRASGLSAKKWCDDNQVNVHTLTAWITRLNLQQNQTAKADAASDPVSEQVPDRVNATDQTDINSEITEANESIATAMSDDTPDSVVNADSPSEPSNTDIPEFTADGSPNRPTVVIRHGAITITAQENYDKATLMALVDVLLGRDTTDTTTLNRE